MPSGMLALPRGPRLPRVPPRNDLWSGRHSENGDTRAQTILQDLYDYAQQIVPG